MVMTTTHNVHRKELHLLSWRKITYHIVYYIEKDVSSETSTKTGKFSMRAE